MANINYTDVETRLGTARKSYDQSIGKQVGKVASSIGSGTLDALEGLANWIGLGNWFKRTFIKKNYDEATVKSALNRIVQEAMAQGEQKLSELNDKLLYMPKASPTISSFINQTRSDILAKIRKQTTQNAQIAAKAADIDYHLEKASNASAGDIAHGEAEKEIEEAKKIANMLPKYEERI